MPLVIPQTGPVQYVPTDEILGEILGHDNFDGETWAVGDRLIFEAGTESRIKQDPGELFYTWDDPVPADLEEVKRTVGVPNARDWEELFAYFRAQTKRSGCASSVVLMLTAAMISALMTL